MTLYSDLKAAVHEAAKGFLGDKTVALQFQWEEKHGMLRQAEQNPLGSVVTFSRPLEILHALG